MQSLFLLGVRVDDVTYDEAVEAIERFVRDGGPRLVTTPNPEFVMMAQRDAEFRDVLNSAALAIPDGVGLILGARLLGQRLREHVRGTDLVDRIAERCARAGYRIFLLGAAEGVAAAAAGNLQRRFPGLSVAGTFTGSPGCAEEPRIRAVLRAAMPIHVLLVAYGAPAQEKWLARNLEPLGIPVGIGVGGVFNFLAGQSRRAPAWVRRLELEWLHRLLTEPWRWRRQMALPRFAARVAREAVLRRGGVRGGWGPGSGGRGPGGG